MDLPTHKLVCNDCEEETECANLISFNTFTPLPEGYVIITIVQNVIQRILKKLKLKVEQKFLFNLY